MESFSYVMLQMCVTGLVYPVTAAAFGAIWTIGRVVYGIGYASKGPSGRMAGGLLSHMGDIPLAILTMKVGYTMIMKTRGA